MAYELKKEISSNTNNLSTKCSCSLCESTVCFTKRHYCSPYICEICTSKPCINSNFKNCYTNNLIEVYLNAAKTRLAPAQPFELTEMDMNYELDRQELMIQNIQPPKSLEEYIKRFLSKPSPDKTENKPASLREYIYIISGQNTQAFGEYINKLKAVNYEEDIKNPDVGEGDTKEMNECKGYCENKCSGKCERKCRKHKNEYERQTINIKRPDFETEIRSVMLSCPHIDFNPVNKIYNNQIKAVDKYEDKNSNESNYSIFNYDIFKRLKDAYNACSCIVCKCIPTMTLQNDVCSCKPCECLDCTHYLTSNTYHRNEKQKYGLKFTPSQYINHFIQTQKKQKVCSCKPCDCALCQQPNSTKPCDCDQCKCNECTPAMTIEEIPSGDKYKEHLCHCAPCDCSLCEHEDNTISKSSSRHVSTVKHLDASCRFKMCTNDICAVGTPTSKCDNLNSLNKEAQNVDMQTTLILNDIYHHGNDTKNNNQNMLAMYTTLSHARNTIESNLNTKLCSCSDCECLTCVCKEYAINAIKSSQLFSCHKTLIENSYSSNHCIKNICDCTVCECQVSTDSKHKKEKQPVHQTINKSLKTNKITCSCKCDTCFCSETLPKSTTLYGSKSKCSTCISERCFSQERRPTRSISKAFPIKKGDVLTPLAHQIKVRQRKLTEGRLQATDLTSRRRSLNIENSHSQIKSQPEIISYNLNTKTSLSASVTCKPSFTLNSNNKTNKAAAEIKLDAYVQCRDWRKKNSSFSYKLPDNISNCISVYPSTRIYSFSKEIENGNSSLDTKDYCNNSLFDQYAIQYPKSTAETCYKEVMMRDLGNKIKRKTFDSNSKHYKEAIAEKKKPATSIATTKDIKESVKGYKSSINISVKGNIHYIPDENKISNKTIKPFYVKYGTRATNSSTYKSINSAYESIKYEKRETKSTPTVTNKNNYDNFFQDLKQITAACNKSFNNIHHEEIPKFIRDVDLKTKSKESSYTSFTYDFNIDNVDENYKRIKRTLRDANEFSMKLLKLLDTYERANKEFKKTSDVLTNSQGTIIIKRDLNNMQELFDDKSENLIGNESKSLQFGDATTPWSSITDDTNMSLNDLLLETASNTCPIKYLLGGLDNTKSDGQLSFIKYETADKTNAVDMNVVDSHSEIQFQEACHQTQEGNKKRDININKIVNSSGVITLNNDDIMKTEEKMLRKNQQSSTKRGLHVSKRDTLKKKNLNYNTFDTNLVRHTANVTKEEQTNLIAESRPGIDNEKIRSRCSRRKHGLSLVMGILGNTEEIPKISSLYSTDNPSANEIQLEAHELSAVTIPPSHTFDKPEYRNETTNYSPERNQRQPQKINKLIGDELLYNDREVSCCDLQNMEDSEADVKELLNEFVMQSASKANITSENIKDNSSQLNLDICSSLKVDFQLVRKVSDHTVLVKWRQPQDVNKVQGYELLVDCRAVQKIYSPSKCLAVVTCLPHTEKVLLTIRTLTCVVPKTGIFPATTIIYRPRDRKQ